MSRVEFAPYDRLLDQRPARTPFGRKMPEDCFGRFDASEAIIREPLSDIEATTDLAYMHEAYAHSFYGHMEQRRPDKAYSAELRLNDFITFHREYRLHRWNGQGVEESLYHARRSTQRMKLPHEDTSHLEDIAHLHRAWATSTIDA